MGRLGASLFGYELPLLLLGGFRLIIDDLHTELGARGHPDARPHHSFALQAISPDGCTVGELGRRLGVSKQAAAKTAAALVGLDYVRRADIPGDRRAQRLEPTDRGAELLSFSAEIFDRIRDRWCAALGPRRLATVERGLDQLLAGTDLAARLDVPGWLSS